MSCEKRYARMCFIQPPHRCTSAWNKHLKDWPELCSLNQRMEPRPSFGFMQSPFPRRRRQRERHPHLRRNLPGYELFQYLDENGRRRSIESSDVNDYLPEIAGEEYTAKDFRTWAGTVLAPRALQEFEAFDSEAQAKRNVVQAIESVAKRRGNTKAVCRKCYIHPAVINTYLDGTLLQTLSRKVKKVMTESLSKLRPRGSRRHGASATAPEA